MQVDVSHRHQRHGSGVAYLAQLVQPQLIGQCAQLLHAQPAAAHKVLQGPAPNFQQLLWCAARLGGEHKHTVCKVGAL